jgi:hypothetical protein
MEKKPQWNQTAEDLMASLGRKTDPSRLTLYDETIKLIYYQDEDGHSAIVPVDGESEAEGPCVGDPFNPNSN